MGNLPCPTADPPPPLLLCCIFLVSPAGSEGRVLVASSDNFFSPFKLSCSYKMLSDETWPRWKKDGKAGCQSIVNALKINVSLHAVHHVYPNLKLLTTFLSSTIRIFNICRIEVVLKLSCEFVLSFIFLLFCSRRISAWERRRSLSNAPTPCLTWSRRGLNNYHGW